MVPDQIYIPPNVVIKPDDGIKDEKVTVEEVTIAPAVELFGLDLITNQEAAAQFRANVLT